MHRLPKLTHEEFQDYWYGTHAPLVKGLASAMRIRRYVQLHPTQMALTTAMARFRGLDDPIDGAAELWWDSIEDMTLQSPEGRDATRILIEDEKMFVDLPRSSLLLVNDRPIIDP